VRAYIDQVGPSGVEDLAEAGFGGQDVLDLLAELAHVDDDLARITAERDALAVQVAALQEARDLDAAVSALAAARVLDQELAERPVTIGDAKACRDIARAGHHLNPTTVDALLTSFLVGVGAEERSA
jgi:hypothetical protein